MAASRDKAHSTNPSCGHLQGEGRGPRGLHRLRPEWHPPLAAPVAIGRQDFPPAASVSHADPSLDIKGLPAMYTLGFWRGLAQAGYPLGAERGTEQGNGGLKRAKGLPAVTRQNWRYRDKGY